MNEIVVGDDGSEPGLLAIDWAADEAARSQGAGPYAAFIERTGTPALELGCGDGDPLLELRRRGLEVEGADSSADMLERLRRRAREEGISVTFISGRERDATRC